MVAYHDHNQIQIYLVFAQTNVKVIHALDTFCKDQRNKRSAGSNRIALDSILLETFYDQKIRNEGSLSP